MKRRGGLLVLWLIVLTWGVLTWLNDRDQWRELKSLQQASDEQQKLMRQLIEHGDGGVEPAPAGDKSLAEVRGKRR